jgi:DNA-binding CsgD family transcriptional regulator
MPDTIQPIPSSRPNRADTSALALVALNQSPFSCFFIYSGHSKEVADGNLWSFLDRCYYGCICAIGYNERLKCLHFIDTNQHSSLEEYSYGGLSMSKRHWWKSKAQEVLRKYSPITSRHMVGALEQALPIIEMTGSSKTLADLNAALAAFCRYHGVNRSGWAFIENNGGDNLRTMNDNIGFNIGDVSDNYEQEGIAHIDVFNHIARCSINPIPWGLPHHYVDRCKEEKRLHSFYRDIGCARGIMLPLHGPDRTLTCGFNFTDSEKDFSGRIPQFTAQAHLFCATFHEALQRLVFAGQRDDTNLLGKNPLTNRESECIRWAALGKTAWEISCILSIAERTVFVHMDNAKKKLEAKTLPQAVGRAVMLGIISL